VSSQQIEKYHVELTSPVRYEKVGDILEVEGVILKEGTFTDKDGKTFHYSMDVLDRAKESFEGVPIVYPHTEEEEGATEILNKIGGFTTEVWMEGKELLYKGIVYKPQLIRDILSKNLDGHSIEAGVEAIRDPSMSVANVVTLSGEAVCITDRPACVDCQVKSIQLKSAIELEESERTTSLSPSVRSEFGSGSGSLKRRVSSSSNRASEIKIGEQVKMSEEEENEGEQSI